MFSKEQVEVLYLLVEKGVISEGAVKAFLVSKLAEIGLKEPEPVAPAEPVAPVAPEAPTA